MDTQDAELLFRLIRFAHETVRWMALFVMDGLAFLYDLTPQSWPDPWRFGSIAAVLGIAYGVLLVIRR